MCLVALNGKMLQPFFLPFSIKPALGVTEDLSIHSNVHAFQEKVVLGVAALVHVPAECFNQATQVQVPTALNAKALLAADFIFIRTLRCSC